MTLKLVFNRHPGHFAITYDRETRELADWLSSGRLAHIHAELDAKIKRMTAERLAAR